MPLGIAEDIATAAPFILSAEPLDATLQELLQQMEDGTVCAVFTAIDQAALDGSAPFRASLAAAPLLACAGYRLQRRFELRDDRIIAGDPADIEKARPIRQPVDPKLWERLQAHAARTYVPATEASRLKGAGAGLSDND